MMILLAESSVTIRVDGSSKILPVQVDLG